MEWLPIETAPKDGIAFIGYKKVTDKNWVIAAMYFSDGDFKMVEFNEGNYENTYHPTHWMPLPTPPVNDENKSIDTEQTK